MINFIRYIPFLLFVLGVAIIESYVLVSIKKEEASKMHMTTITNTIVLKMDIEEALFTFKHLLSDPQFYTEHIENDYLKIDLSEVDKQILRKELFAWLKKRIEEDF